MDKLGMGKMKKIQSFSKSVRRFMTPYLSLSLLVGVSACDPDAAGSEKNGPPKQDESGIDAPAEPKPDGPASDDAEVSDAQLPEHEPDDGKPGNGQNDCGESKFKAEPLPPNVMLVLDKSGSMSIEKWEDNGVMKSRWESLHGTTKFLLESFGKQVNFGLKLFPSNQSGSIFDFTKACEVSTGVDVECSSDSFQSIMKLLPAATFAVQGNTPTAAGLQEAYSYLKTLNDPNPEAVVLIVDGRTNCGQSNELLAATAASAFAEGIKVYVVGIDLDDATVSSLSPAAVAGGTEKIFNSSDSSALSKSLESILGGISSCAIPLESAPPYPKEVTVKLGKSEEIQFRSEFSSCEELKAAGHSAGWIYLSESGANAALELCAESCEAFKKSPEVDITFGCPPPV